MKKVLLIVAAALGFACTPSPDCSRTARSCTDACAPLPVATFKLPQCSDDHIVVYERSACYCGTFATVDKPAEAK